MLSNASISLSAFTPSGTLAHAQPRGKFKLKGRTRPMFVNSTISGRTYHVEMALFTSADYATLQSIHDSRAIVCYRDHKGNLLFGRIARLPSREDLTVRGCTFDVTEVEYAEAL